VSQYLAYCHFVGIKPKISEDATVFNTSGGNVKVFGRADIFVPMAPIRDIVVMQTKLFNSPSTAPILFSMALMNELRVELHNTRSNVCQVDTGNTIDIRFVHQLPVYSWDQSKNKDIHHFLLNRDMQRSLYSEAELRNIHRRLGHPTAQRIMRIMERSGRLQDIDPGTRQRLKEIEKNCIACQKHSGPPQRFRFHISNEDGRFNHELIADIMYLDNGNVLHVIDADTRFQSAQFITDQKARTIWKALRRCWIDIYCGPPDVLRVDSGSNFTSTEFAQLSAAQGVVLQIAPVEAHHLIGMVERNHAVLRRVYEKLKLEMPAMDRDSILSMSVRAVNDSTGPDGLIPTVRVFGIFPRLGIPGEKPTPTMAERVKAISEATELASREYARRTLTSASKSGPSPNADTVRAVRELNPGSSILVHRENAGWTGPHSVVRMDDDKVSFASKKGVTTVPISVCKPFYETSEYTRSLPIFEASRASELEKHRQLGTFEVVPRVSAQGARIFHGTFVDVIKSSGLARSRLVACATNDNVDYLTASPTVQRYSTRVSFAVAACRRDFEVKFRDITMAFLQSETLISRNAYMEPPPEMNLPHSSILRIRKPLYGLPESPMHWYRTYAKYHADKNGLGMTIAAHDPCLFAAFTPEKDCVGIVTLQVDDSTIMGTREFQEFEEKQSSRFPNKGSQYVDDVPREQNGAMIHATVTAGKTTYHLCQEKHLKKLRQIHASNIKDEYRQLKSNNALAAFAAHGTRPDLLIYVALFSQITEGRYRQSDRAHFNRFVKLCEDTSNRRMNFVGLDLDTMHIAVFVDASFATNWDGSSQLGILVCLRDAHARCNILHATSVKSKRVARSSLAAEIFAMLDGFDIGFVLKVWMGRIFNRTLELHILTDSRTGFHAVTTLVTTKEKRLMLDLHQLRESYERRELTKITWITGNSNPADCLTKIKHNNKLESVLLHNVIEIDMSGWIDRPMAEEFVANSAEPQPTSGQKEKEASVAELPCDPAQDDLPRHQHQEQCAPVSTPISDALSESSPTSRNV
jgi:hypothetical protein